MAEELRGSVINGYLKYVKKSWGAEGLAALEEETGLDHRKIKDGQFYPREAINKVLLWISSNHGMDRVKRGGKATAQDLGLFKYLVRWSSLEHMISRAVNIYGELYKYGKIRAWYEEDRVRIEMEDANRLREDCYAWLGAFEGIAELTHTKADVKEEECIFRGGDKCVYYLYLK
ncbi:MAG: hypothetical protein J7L61_01440 [Thermoplasmata archaeon]|nr:hypothetical protein [Thermoplasmata archaeon]